MVPSPPCLIASESSAAMMRRARLSVLRMGRPEYERGDEWNECEDAKATSSSFRAGMSRRRSRQLWRHPVELTRYDQAMSNKAACPHCGARTSQVYSEWRCSCGWADPDLHEPYQRLPEIDLSRAEWEHALEDPTELLAEVRRQLSAPPVSMRDGLPVLHQELAPLLTRS
jgi:hypothetical protein